MTIDVTMPLGELVNADPRRSRILEGFGLDYCCNGHRSLIAATTEAGVDLTEVAAALDLPGSARTEPTTGARENATLAHDIVDSHHAYMWEEMPRLMALVEKVHGVHVEQHSELTEIRDTYAEAITALDPHMARRSVSSSPPSVVWRRPGSPSPAHWLSPCSGSGMSTKWSATCSSASAR